MSGFLRHAVVIGRWAQAHPTHALRMACMRAQRIVGWALAHLLSILGTLPGRVNAVG